MNVPVRRLICAQCGQTRHPGLRCAYMSVPIAYSNGTRRAMAVIEEQLQAQQAYWDSGNGSTTAEAMAENSMIYGRMVGLAIAMVAICEAHRQEADRERWYKVQAYLSKSARTYAELRLPKSEGERPAELHDSDCLGDCCVYLTTQRHKDPAQRTVLHYRDGRVAP